MIACLIPRSAYVAGEIVDSHPAGYRHSGDLRHIHRPLADQVASQDRVGRAVDDELAEACAKDWRYEFLFVAPAIPITGAVGSPGNPYSVK